MNNDEYRLGKFSIRPIKVWLHVPPAVWKGDRLGHIGINDTFFYMVKGECFLSIDNHSILVKEGQLAFLPKDKMRVYTHTSKNFVMYEMAFSAQIEDKDLMQHLGLSNGDFAVDVSDKEKMCKYFEASCRNEMRRDPVFDIGWCANILLIIQEYANAHKTKKGKDAKFFEPVLEYMAQNLEKPIKTNELAEIVFMQTTYFIRRFGVVYGISPQNYLSKMRMAKAMELLSNTDLPIEKIAVAVGIPDTSYFSRVFKKYCGVPPGGYRAAFLSK